MSKTHEHHAFPEQPDIEAAMRFGSVKRWHMLDTVRIQTLAEHSGNVALLAMIIAYHAPGMYFGACGVVAATALVHDLPEVFTGDIPTPTKRHITGLDKMEDSLLTTLPRMGVSEDVKILIKICDLADGIRFIRLHGSGAIGQHATEGLIEQFDNWVAKGIQAWPPEVLSHVVEKAWFYAHETGIADAAGSEIPNGRPVAPNLARGQGDITGGAGFVVCDDGYRARNGMARAKSIKLPSEPAGDA